MEYAFVTGMGRSGTKFLSSLLALDKEVFVGHEYIGNREYWLVSWYLGEEYSKILLQKEKSKIDSEINKNLFIDVNGYLSDSTKSLKTVFENTNIFHLVRNPKKVVPSLMIRRDDSRIHKIPKIESEINDWISMSKLEQVCVNWVQTTEDLLNSNATLLKFENLISDYQYLSEKLLTPLNLNISVEIYDSFKSKKINKTRSKLYRYLYAKYKSKHFVSKNVSFEDFNKKELELFYNICGSTMKRIQYK